MRLRAFDDHIFSIPQTSHGARNAPPHKEFLTVNVTKQIISGKSSKSCVYSTPQSLPTNRGLPPALCQYCTADRPYVVAIPGLRGQKCACGLWLGQCPSCDQWVTRLKGGICQKCRRDKAIALIEQRKTREKAARRRKRYGNGLGQGSIVGGQGNV
jgi:hypothetical protein